MQLSVTGHIFNLNSLQYERKTLVVIIYNLQNFIYSYRVLRGTIFDYYFLSF